MSEFIIFNFSSLLADIKAHFEDPDKNKYPNEDFLFEIANLLEGIGLHNPLEKIYLTTKNIEHISTILFLFVISQLSKLTYVKNIGECFFPRHLRC